MHGANTPQDERPESTLKLLRRVVTPSRRRRQQMSTAAINLALYAILVVAYFIVVLQWLNEPIARLFELDMPRYAVVCVLLILGQGLLLDIVTASLLRLARRLSGKRRS